MDMARRFLQALGTGPWCFQWFDDTKQEKVRPGHETAEFDYIEPRLKRLNEKGAGIYVTVNRTDRRGRKAENIVEVRALFVDLDGAPLEPVLEAPTKPHIVVESSPGRYHAYWKVEDFPLDRFTPAQKALAKRFDGDKAVHDLPRVMRLPGFYHRKAESFLSALLEK
jgi:hypothetical protein